MTLVFPAWRRGHLKCTGPVIDEAIRRGHAVRLWWKGDLKDPVSYEALHEEWPEAEIIGAGDDRADACIVPLASRYAQLPPARHLVSTDYCLEHLSLPPDPRVTVMCHTSEWAWKTWQQRYLYLSNPWPMTRHLVTGDPMYDVFHWLSVDPTPRVILFSAKFNVPDRWRRWQYRWTHYLCLVLALRRFCRRRGVAFCIKTRDKHSDPPWLRSCADSFVTDDGLLIPYGSAILLPGAFWTVHFHSGAVYEAAYAGVPSLSVALPWPYQDPWVSQLETWEAYTWSGVSREVEWQHARTLLRSMETFPLISPRSRTRFLERYCGFEDGKSASRVLDAVEEYCA